MIILLMFICHSMSFSQNTSKAKKIRVRMNLAFYNNADKSREIKAGLFYIQDRVRIPITDRMVTFYLGDIAEGMVIDSLLTDENGEAILKFSEDKKFTVDEERALSIAASYNGNGNYSGADAEITIKDLSLELFLSEINSEKTISIRAYELGNNKEMVPVEEASVSFYVPRLFSDQLIGEGKINDGKCSIKFPENIAGDTIGNISLIARIEDDKYYGNVEREINDFRWGNTQPIEEDKSLMTIEITIPTRALWHTNAPLWMIVTLIILLTGVWSHYVYVIYQLVKLSRISKKAKVTQQE